MSSDTSLPDARLRDLLARVVAEKTYYPRLDPSDPEGPLLRRLAALGLIRWCPYPDEFYIPVVQSSPYQRAG